MRDGARVVTARLTAPFPYFGAKSAIASRVWEAFGNPGNYVEPFFGSGAVLLSRPDVGRVETANDACGFVPNAWRAISADPEAVASHADWPVSEADLHARHAWLVDRMTPAFVERLSSNHEYFDAKVAGIWIWGLSIWIGDGWCEGRIQVGTGIMRQGIGVNRQLPRLAGWTGTHVTYGAGVNTRERRDQLSEYFHALQARLRHVRFACGDWSRVITESVTVSHGLTGVFLDPPYGEGARRKARLYAVDSLSVASDAARWAIEHGDDPRYRIVLCGYEGEHEMPANWRVVAWKSRSGYANASRERLYLSPHCLGSDARPGPLFEAVS